MDGVRSFNEGWREDLGYYCFSILLMRRVLRSDGDLCLSTDVAKISSGKCLYLMSFELMVIYIAQMHETPTLCNSKADTDAHQLSTNEGPGSVRPSVAQ